MSGVRRLVVGEISQGKTRGKALGDALARELNGEQKSVDRLKSKVDKPMKKSYGKKK